MDLKKYILITAARNEENYIERTIQSILQQTYLPLRWAIISDESTDRTDDIVQQYVQSYDFIQYLRVSNLPPIVNQIGITAFRKVNAINLGLKLFSDLEYDFLGILDADISLDKSYYSKVIECFEKDDHLGIAGGQLFHIDHHNKTWVNDANLESVAGAVQFFRVTCFKEIGGYLSCAFEDSLANVIARMKGWRVKTFPELKVIHHKPAGLPGRNLFRAKFHVGKMEHVMGDLFLYELARCLGNIKERPFLIGSLARMSGYIWSMIQRNPIQPPTDVVKYMRKVQKRRLLSVFN